MSAGQREFLSVAVFALALSTQGAEVRQVFRQTRDTLDATNVSVVQSADRAAWIWMPGHDVWGASAIIIAPIPK